MEAQYLHDALDLVEISKQTRPGIQKLRPTEHEPDHINIPDIIGEPTALDNFGLDDSNACMPDNIILVRDVEVITRRNVTLAACAVFEVKAKTGAYRASLPGDFLDPMNNKPLGYQLEPEGFMIYSAGESGKFDGELEKSGESNAEIFFRYPIVKEKRTD